MFFSRYLVPLNMLIGYATGELRLFKVVSWVWLGVVALDFMVGHVSDGAPEDRTRVSKGSLLS